MLSLPVRLAKFTSIVSTALLAALLLVCLLIAIQLGQVHRTLDAQLGTLLAIETQAQLTQFHILRLNTLLAGQGHNGTMQEVDDGDDR